MPVLVADVFPEMRHDAIRSEAAPTARPGVAGNLQPAMRVGPFLHCCSSLSDAYGHSLHTVYSVGANMPTQSRRPTPEQIAEELDGLVETRDVERAASYTRR